MVRKRVAAIAILGGILGIAVAVGILQAAGPGEQLPPEKQALADYMAAFRQAGTPADKSKDAGRPLIVQVDGPPRTGMLGAAQAPAYGGLFTTNNAWAGWLDSTTFVVVYAGAPSDEPGHGLVLAERRVGADGLVDPTVEPVVTLVPAPMPGGPLRIVRVVDGEVIVANPGGQEFRFNPLSGVFD